jgi:hypothetical protein
MMSFSISSIFISVYGMSAESINLVYHYSLSQAEEDDIP